MDKLKAIKVFCTVLEKGNFSSAASALNITPAMVGRQVAALEQEVGVQLLKRTTRKMQVTPSGRHYFARVKRIIDELNDLEQEIANEQHSMSGLISLSFPDALGRCLIENVISAFKKVHPNVQFRLLSQNSYTDLVESNIDIAIRMSIDLEDASYIAVRLMKTSLGLYASTDYIKECGEPICTKELNEHQCIIMGDTRFGLNWMLKSKSDYFHYTKEWDVILNDTESLLSAVRNGMGIAQIPTILIQHDLDKNVLTRINKISEDIELGIFAVYPTKKLQPYRVRKFLAFLKKQF